MEEQQKKDEKTKADKEPRKEKIELTDDDLDGVSGGAVPFHPPRRLGGDSS